MINNIPAKYIIGALVESKKLRDFFTDIAPDLDRQEALDRSCAFIFTAVTGVTGQANFVDSCDINASIKSEDLVKMLIDDNGFAKDFCDAASSDNLDINQLDDIIVANLPSIEPS